MSIAYLGLGSNMGKRLNYLKHAVKLLQAEETITIENLSAVYETAPVGGPDQGPYLNACVAVSTELSATRLLLKLLDLENLIGRVREVRWGPRVIDLDLLVYENIIMNTPLLELPHPRMCERDFVLIPMADIAPNLLIPGCNKSVYELITRHDLTGNIKLYLSRGWEV